MTTKNNKAVKNASPRDDQQATDKMITFTRDRITLLRLLKGVSEYQMSYDLGHSRGYINNISSGKSLPSMKEFFAICSYFNITPTNFFDVTTENPELFNKAVNGLRRLNDNDKQLILNHINRLLECN